MKFTIEWLNFKTGERLTLNTFGIDQFAFIISEFTKLDPTDYQIVSIDIDDKRMRAAEKRQANKTRNIAMQAYMNGILK